MKEIIQELLFYPFIVVFDIATFFNKLFSNLIYSFKKPKFNYEDIIEVKYFMDEIMDLETTIFYQEGNTKPVNDLATIISLDKNKFNELVDVLAKNKLFKYKKYIYTFSITPFSDLFCADAGEGCNELTFEFKDGREYQLTSYCESKEFDNVIRYIEKLIGENKEVPQYKVGDANEMNCSNELEENGLIVWEGMNEKDPNKKYKLKMS